MARSVARTTTPRTITVEIPEAVAIRHAVTLNATTADLDRIRAAERIALERAERTCPRCGFVMAPDESNWDEHSSTCKVRYERHLADDERAPHSQQEADIRFARVVASAIRDGRMGR